MLDWKMDWNGGMDNGMDHGIKKESTFFTAIPHAVPTPLCRYLLTNLFIASSTLYCPALRCSLLEAVRIKGHVHFSFNRLIYC